MEESTLHCVKDMGGCGGTRVCNLPLVCCHSSKPQGGGAPHSAHWAYSGGPPSSEGQPCGYWLYQWQRAPPHKPVPHHHVPIGRWARQLGALVARCWATPWPPHSLFEGPLVPLGRATITVPGLGCLPLAMVPTHPCRLLGGLPPQCRCGWAYWFGGVWQGGALWGLVGAFVRWVGTQTTKLAD